MHDSVEAKSHSAMQPQQKFSVTYNKLDEAVKILYCGLLQYGSLV